MRQLLLVSIACIAIIACGGEKEKKKEVFTPPPVASVDGAQVFKLSCAVCHGEDGKLGANGAKDITASKLTVDERIALVTKGKGLMPAQEHILTSAEIKAVVEYTTTMK
jgi:cytochrome c6